MDGKRRSARYAFTQNGRRKAGETRDPQAGRFLRMRSRYAVVQQEEPPRSNSREKDCLWYHEAVLAVKRALTIFL